MNKTAIVIGSLVLAGIGAYFYFRPKSEEVLDTSNTTGSANSTNNSGTSSLDNTVTQTTDTVTNEPLKQPIVKTLSNEDMLEIQKLRDIILADMRRKGTYKKSGSRNAVQADINKNIEKLKVYGYALDLQNNLIKLG